MAPSRGSFETSVSTEDKGIIIYQDYLNTTSQQEAHVSRNEARELAKLFNLFVPLLSAGH